MASTEVTICNLALGELGSKTILALTESSSEARACRLFYEQTRDEVLRSHRWNFAIKRTTLSALSALPPFGWDKQYQLPPDCLRVLQVNGWEECEREDNWSVEGGRLLTDASNVQLRYIARVTDASKYDPIFIEALAVKLASKLAQPLTGSRTIPGDLLTKYERISGPQARRMNAIERRFKTKKSFIESDFVASRFGSGCGTSTTFTETTEEESPCPEPTYVICNAFGSSGTFYAGTYERFRLYADNVLIFELDGITYPNWIGDTNGNEPNSIAPATVRIPDGTKEVSLYLLENSNAYPVAPQPITPPFPNLTTGSSWHYRFIFIGGTEATHEDDFTSSGFKYSPQSGDPYWNATGKTGVETKVFTQQIS